MTELTESAGSVPSPPSAALDEIIGHRVPLDWREDVMVFAGVKRIAAIRDEAGEVIELLVDPPLDQMTYDAAAAATLKVQLKAYAADLRWRREIGGILVAGLPVATDDRSKMMILGARVAAAANPDWVTVWHGADGGSYPINAAAMVAISDAVQAHVNQWFATFSIVDAAIVTGEITTKAEIDAAFAT